VTADRQRLVQVLLNLLSNAVKYNREGGTVMIACEEAPGERLWIVVQDTGPGIPPEKLDRLFVPFDRLDAETSGIEGTGLGLALSKALVEAMNGSVHVRSEAGAGSAFAVELARNESPATRHERTGAAASTTETGSPATRRIVLYIEDNLPNLELVEQILARWPGVGIVPAMQGRLGVELARRHHPDLVLLDVHLPDMSGTDVLSALQADPLTRDIPVIVISADATPGQIARLRAGGAREYLTKPLDVARFLAIVGGILEGAG
jgi:CheY-like chemotaxis protein/anti-sigma regulatory factor (Ser/Thr protein kinase)